MMYSIANNEFLEKIQKSSYSRTMETLIPMRSKEYYDTLDNYSRNDGWRNLWWSYEVINRSSELSREEMSESSKSSSKSNHDLTDIFSFSNLRKRIISDEFIGPDHFYYNPKENIWYQEDKLYTDHLQEILDKWDKIDDGIWGKLIYMENNRRVAKAYTRASLITINGTWDDFDGYSIGLQAFENPFREHRSSQVLKHLDNGFVFKVDKVGNIMIRKNCRCDIYVQGWHNGVLNSNDTTLSDEIMMAKGRVGKQYLSAFDMKKFKRNIEEEMKNGTGDKNKLLMQCIIVITIEEDMPNILDSPAWIMLINIVALKVLKSKVKGKRWKSLITTLWSTMKRLRKSISRNHNFMFINDEL